MKIPIRVQRKRTRGWKMPENTIYVGRQNDGCYNIGEFGNPFRIGQLFKIGNGKSQGEMSWCRCLSEEYNNGTFIKIKDNAHAVEMYKEYLQLYPLSHNNINKLKGKNLACWCRLDEPCHADILLEIANK